MTCKLRFCAHVLSLLFAFDYVSYAQSTDKSAPSTPATNSSAAKSPTTTPPANTPSVRSTQSDVCPQDKPNHDIRINEFGTPTNLGSTREAPICVELIFNTFRFDASLIGTTSVKGGIDPSSVLTPGGNKAVGLLGPADTVPGQIAQLDETIFYVRNFLAFVDRQIAGENPGIIASAALAEADRKLANGNSLRQQLGLAYNIAYSQKTPGGGTRDELKTLNQRIQTVRIWIDRFSQRGIDPNSGETDPKDQEAIHKERAEPLVRALVRFTQVKCANIFNASATTVFAVTVTDNTPTLSDPTAQPKPNSIPSVYTATCSSPVSVSAGIEISGIRNQEFAIIKVPNSSGTGSISKYGLVTDSAIHPLPVAVANFRILDFDEAKRWAMHASLGISGNIQGQGSGGSSVEFLPGVSFSFIRSVFLTVGPHIGQKSELAGGIKVGDTVLPDASSPPTVTKSYIVRWGVAITFSKP